MASRIRLLDGREITIALDGKRVISTLQSLPNGDRFARFNTSAEVRVWINPSHVSAVEDRPDLD